MRNWQNARSLASLGVVGVFGVRSAAPVPPPPDMELWRSSRNASLSDPAQFGPSALEWLRQPLGHPSDRFFSEGAALEVDKLLDDFRPDVVVLEHVWMHRYLDVVRSGGCRVILDLHNVEGALQRELSDSPSGRRLPPMLRSKLDERTQAIEGAAIRSVDQVWVCSRRDARLVRDRYAPRGSIVVVPNTVDVGSYRRRAAGTDGAPTLLYPGVFDYPPNANAARFLLEDLLPPLVARMPSARLVLLGRSPTSQILAAGKRDSRVVVTGAVPDVRPYLARSTAMPVPLFEGGGTRFKVLEAFASRVPVVSTAKGVEGLALSAGEHYLPAEAPLEFVEAIERLWSDRKEARRIAEAASEVVRELYSWEAAAACVRAALDELAGGR